MDNGSPISEFESAVDAVVAGDVPTLESLLHRNPELIRTRSAREHQSTLLHYVSANGVEDHRQKTPKNIVEVANLLLDAGAEVDAPQASYGGGGTALGLVATSIHPARAGVQIALIDLLLEHGASIDGRSDGWNPLMSALANNRPEAAEALAARGARVDGIVAAAGVGRLDLVASYVNRAGFDPSVPDVGKAFVWAARYGRTSVVEYLLQKGVDPAVTDEGGMTGLHWATGTGGLEVVKLLLKHGAPLEARNCYGGTVLGQAVWFAFHPQWHGVDNVAVIKTLLAAGARIDADPSLKEQVDEVLGRC